MSTKIEWTCGADGSPGETWNIVVGCDPVSPGCAHCYAVKSARRQALLRDDAYNRYRPLVENFWSADSRKWKWSGKIEFFPERLERPLHWRKPRKIFVCSLSDLCHEEVPDDFFFAVLGIAALAPQHTFQILTKRAKRLESLMDCYGAIEEIAVKACVGSALNYIGARPVCHVDWDTWPLPNVWLGVTAENQKTYDERSAHLRRTPAVVRFISSEPMLERINYRLSWSQDDVVWRRVHGGSFERAPIHQVIFGHESGPGARAGKVDWIRDGVRQCQEAGVAPFVKQVQVWKCRRCGSCFEEPQEFSHDGCGSDTPDVDIRRYLSKCPDEWSSDLRFRETPA